MKCDTCKMIRVCNELERMEKVPKHEKCRCYSQAKPITNADRIRAMTDEELAAWLEENSTGCPPGKDDCYGPSANPSKTECVKCWLDWLRQKADHE